MYDCFICFRMFWYISRLDTITCFLITHNYIPISQTKDGDESSTPHPDCRLLRWPSHEKHISAVYITRKSVFWTNSRCCRMRSLHRFLRLWNHLSRGHWDALTNSINTIHSHFCRLSTGQKRRANSLCLRIYKLYVGVWNTWFHIKYASCLFICSLYVSLSLFVSTRAPVYHTKFTPSINNRFSFLSTFNTFPCFPLSLPEITST